LKKITFVLVVSASAMLMVLPLIRGVNHLANNVIGIEKTLRVDGTPVPVPLPPPAIWAPTGESLLADGTPVPVPLPPPAIWTATGESLLADGTPVPVPLPPPSFVV
jgi:hypothetical protein